MTETTTSSWLELELALTVIMPQLSAAAASESDGFTGTTAPIGDADVDKSPTVESKPVVSIGLPVVDMGSDVDSGTSGVLDDG